MVLGQQQDINNNNKFFEELFKIFKRGYIDTVKD